LASNENRAVSRRPDNESHRMPTIENLRENAAVLQKAARSLLGDTGLLQLLGDTFGPPEVVGSVALDMMTWPDIDIHLPLAYADRRRLPDLMPTLYARFDSAGFAVHRMNFLDDYVDPHPLGAGLYCGIWLVERSTERRPWKCDIWGWEPADFERRQERWRKLVADLAGADRDLILRLKDEARGRPGCYGDRVASMDLYVFAIEHAGETLDQLEAFAERRRAKGS